MNLNLGILNKLPEISSVVDVEDTLSFPIFFSLFELLSDLVRHHFTTQITSNNIVNTNSATSAQKTKFSSKFIRAVTPTSFWFSKNLTSGPFPTTQTIRVSLNEKNVAKHSSFIVKGVTATGWKAKRRLYVQPENEPPRSWKRRLCQEAILPTDQVKLRIHFPAIVENYGRVQ